MLLTYLGHDLTQRHLFEIRRLPAHVGPRDDDEVAPVGDVAVVGNQLLSTHPLQNGVTTLLDGQRVCELWTHWQTQHTLISSYLIYCQVQTAMDYTQRCVDETLLHE